MKDLRNTITEDAEMNAWVQACLNAKPRFTSTEEAITFYMNELKVLAQKYNYTIPQFLTEAENSPQSNEDHMIAMRLWQTLSFLKR